MTETHVSWKEQQAERLETLIGYLRRLQETEPDRFDIRRWVSSHDLKDMTKARKQWPKRYKEGQPLDCGTSACVVGHLAVVFPEDFQWEYAPETGTVIRVACVIPGYESVVGALHMARLFGGRALDWSDIIFPEAYTREELDERGQVPLLAVIARIESLRKALASQ